MLLRDIGMGDPILRPMDYTIKYGIHLHLIGKRMKKCYVSYQRLCVVHIFLIIWAYQIKIHSCMPELINISDLLKVSLLGVVALWGDCTLIPADWGS